MTTPKPGLTAGGLVLLAVLVGVPGCRHPTATAGAASREATAPAESPLAAGALVPSPRLIVGRVLSVEAANGFTFVDLASDAPVGAVEDGTELITRTVFLQETGRLRASRYLRGRTLGTRIVAGSPSPGDEVVWLAP